MLLYKNKSNTLSYLLILISVFIYTFIEYFLHRSSFTILVSLWITLFGLSYYLINKSNLDIRYLFYLGILFRVVLLVAVPPLSQDFNRFIWDGRLILKGLNPYLSTPDFWIQNGSAPIHNANELYKAMGNLNATNYTNYPPISQLGYFIAALFGSKSIITSIIVMRLQLIAADIGIFYFGVKILEKLQLPKKNIFIYFLNPFVILELTGNLHYEPLMILFLISSLYYLIQQKWIIASILLGISINVKLLPLLFIPVFVSYFYGETILKQSIANTFTQLYKKRKLIVYYFIFCIITVCTNFLLFLPFYNPKLLENYTSSIGLWFKSFEFNASIYYIIRWVGYQTVGWNIIDTVGKILPLIIILAIVSLSIGTNNSKPKRLFNNLLFSVSIYLMLATTVHPWYLSIPLILSVFTNFKYIYIWSITIVFSYFAYSNPSFKENLVLVALEYIIVFAVLITEIYTLKKKSTKSFSA